MEFLTRQNKENKMIELLTWFKRSYNATWFGNSVL